MNVPETKIAVAVSGGVDSLVATCLLKNQGYDVKGFHFVTGFESNHNENIAKIKSLYAKLDVELEILDLSHPFREKVVDYFTRAYRSGLTPNPCMVCNPSIKFGLLLEHICAQGFAKLATGHYARIEQNDDVCSLLKGLDQAKDQSYFLALLSQIQLSRIMFPLGAMQKSEVKQLAREFGVEPIQKDESQDICFIRGDYVDFLQNRLGFKANKGLVIRRDGTIIGEHRGLYHFTVGQRRGINIPAEKPYYVLELKPQDNVLVVGFAEELGIRRFCVENVNWLCENPQNAFGTYVKIRYRSREIPCTATRLPGDRLMVELNEPQAVVSPGQGAVLFDNDRVLCGGFIVANGHF